VAVTQWVSVFYIRTSRGAKVLWEVLGEGYGAVLTSDRAKAYNGQPLRRHQLCWAHLRRAGRAWWARGGAGADGGRWLLAATVVIFWWWDRVRDGTWARSTFKSYVSFLRGLVREELEAGTRCACRKTAATCRELLQVEAALWTFVRVEGVEPTNNAAEVRSVDQKPSLQARGIGPQVKRGNSGQPENSFRVSV
jgi:transposase